MPRLSVQQGRELLYWHVMLRLPRGYLDLALAKHPCCLARRYQALALSPLKELADHVEHVVAVALTRALSELEVASEDARVNVGNHERLALITLSGYLSCHLHELVNHVALVCERA